MRYWHDLVARPGWLNMAIDQALLEHAVATREEIFRLYTWERDTISLGANEAANRHWHRELLEAAGVPVVRRPTGGRAVWHSADDLTYSTVLPVDGLVGARLAYPKIHQQLIAAIEKIGLSGTLAPRPSQEPGLNAGSCFDSAAGGEVVLAGRKTIGSAQLVRQDTLLQHGEIAREARREELIPYAKTPIVLAETSVATTLPPASVLADAIQAEWRAAGGTEAAPSLVEKILGMADSLGASYRDPAWTWRR